MTKKIVLIHSDFRIYWPARINHFYNSLDKKKYDLTVIEISGHGGNYNFDQIRVSEPYWECLFPDTPMSDLKPSTINRAVLNCLEQIKPSFIITGALAFASGALAVRYSNLNRIPLILFDDAKLQDVKRNILVNWIKKQLYSGVDAIFCPGIEWDATFKFFGFRKEQFFYGVNVIDNDFFNNKTDSLALTLLSRGYFLNVGRQVDKKNLKTLLEAYRIIKERNETIPELVLVGDGVCRREHEEFVRKHELRVHFLNFQFQESLIGLYQNASLFILPSSYGETWGLVVNEAMASGLPVAVSVNVGCANTLIGENNNGFTFDPLDAVALAEKLIGFNVLSSEDKHRMSEASLTKIQPLGLNYFTSGLLSALAYVESKPKRKSTMIGFVLSLLWEGRYRPI